MQHYLAPLEGMNIDEKFPNEYLVELQEGHALDQHFETIGRNFSDSPGFVRFRFGGLASLGDKTPDELVRRDPGVVVVEANFPARLPEPVDRAGVETPDWLHANNTHNKRDYTEVHGKGAPCGLQMTTTGKTDSTYL
jgi:hypothetical protein